MTRTRKTTESTELPKGVTKYDLEYPKYDARLKVKGRKEPGGYKDPSVPMTPGGYDSTLTFIESGRIGWVVATLSINARTNRTYAVDLEGSVFTVGNPASRVVTVHVKESRAKALTPWIEAHKKGLEIAGNVRDRIGSRRAEGQEKRARGLSSWRWDS